VNQNTPILSVAAFAMLGVIAGPRRIPEYVWPVIGAVALIVFGFLPWRNAVTAAAKGIDVYLFLIGMMLLAEVGRREGLFDWLAAIAVRYARGCARRLFLIIYAVGTLVTIFLSNDATAIVLTPAVHAAATAARAKPLPYLFACAFIANAASFVLPISNPANLVIFGTRMPPLAPWLYQFTLPSIASILVTYLLLRFTQRAAIDQRIADDFRTEPLSVGGKCVAVGIALTAMALLAASSLDRQLGLPTFIAGTAVATIVLIISRQSPLSVLRAISWAILPFVAGLFMLVAGVAQTGILNSVSQMLHEVATYSPREASFVAGIVVALASNLMNNLPAGLAAATVSQSADVPLQVTSGILVGTVIGPNLSVTASLATILWLIALRREGEKVTAWQFLKLGIVVMPPGLVVALLATTVVS
jgi:arsenical pump membrane protein